jgi:hypothetical protein
MLMIIARAGHALTHNSQALQRSDSKSTSMLGRLM